MRQSSWLTYCMALFIASRLFFWGEALSIHHALHSTLPLHGLFSILDSTWYATIATTGYSTIKLGFPHIYTVFFPLFPMLLKTVMILTQLPVYLAGQLINYLCFFGALCLFYKWLEQDFDRQTARLGCLLLAFSPYNIYFMAVYTESLFLLLTLIFWRAAKQQRWLLMGIAGCLISATHPNGILIGCFGLWFMWEDWRKNQSLLWTYWPLLLVPLGLVAYMLFLYIEIRQPLAFVHYQIYWARDSWHFGTIILQFLNQCLMQPYNLCIYGIGMALSLFLWNRCFSKEALFIPIFISIALVSGSFVSLARFTGGAFAFYFALTLFTQEKQSRHFVFCAELILSAPLMFWWLTQNVQAY